MLIDSHCHWDFPVFDGQREALWQAALEAGVQALVIPATRQALWAHTRDIAQQQPGWCYAIGLHPYWTGEHADPEPGALAPYREDPRCVAIGECGLDFWHGRQQAERQLALLRAQIRLASAWGWPLILHCRKAHNELLQLLREEDFKGGGILHAFSASPQLAERYVALGFRLGIGGVMTRPSAGRLRDWLARCPLEWLVLETDAPDMAPAFAPQYPNQPAQVARYAALLAQWRQQEPDFIAGQTTANLIQVLPRLAAHLAAHPVAPPT